MEEAKRWFFSKTLWVNAAIAATAWLLESAGVDLGISSQTQLSIMAGVNFVLRKITKTAITK